MSYNYEKQICESKTVFLTRDHANDAAQYATVKALHGRRIQAYVCPHCGLFHLTRKKKDRRKPFTVPEVNSLIRSEAEHWITRKKWSDEQPARRKVKRYRF